MSFDKEESFQPKSVIVESADFFENLQRHVGVINFNQSYGNHTHMFEGIIKVIGIIEDAFEQGIEGLDKKPELKLNKTAVYRIKKLWDSQNYITIENEDLATETWHYDNHAIDYSNPNLEVIPIPAFDQMDLEDNKRSKTLLLKISELIPIKYAWEGMSYGIIVKEGNFQVYTKDGVVAMFDKEDMGSTRIYTPDIARHVYNRIIKKQKTLGLKNWYTLYNNIHKIIVYGKGKGIEEDVTDSEDRMELREKIEYRD